MCWPRCRERNRMGSPTPVGDRNCNFRCRGSAGSAAWLLPLISTSKIHRSHVDLFKQRVHCIWLRPQPVRRETTRDDCRCRSIVSRCAPCPRKNRPRLWAMARVTASSTAAPKSSPPGPRENPPPPHLPAPSPGEGHSPQLSHRVVEACSRDLLGSPRAHPQAF